MESLIFDETITVVGSEAFIDHVRKALALLQSKSPSGYPVVKKYIGRIKEGITSGMYAYYNPPTFQMSAKEALLNESNKDYALQWCASAIVHDAYHSKNSMTIKKLMDTLQVPTPTLRSMYGQVKLLSASALRFKRKFVVRLGLIKRFVNIWKSVMVDTVTHHETGSSFTSFSDNFDCVVTLYGTGLIVTRRCQHSHPVSIFSGVAAPCRWC
jgi:hypothetical protein